MNKLLFILLLFSLPSIAQRADPGFENDTLYTSGGYKIYKGQLLQLTNGTSADGYFRFIKFSPGMNRTDTYILQNSSILVSKLKSFKKFGIDNYSIRVQGTVTYKNGSKADVDITMDFERAIESLDGMASELKVPAELKRKRVETVKEEVKKQPVTDETKKSIADEIKKLFDLYKAGALTKEEYEAQKKKLLGGQ